MISNNASYQIIDLEEMYGVNRSSLSTMNAGKQNNDITLSK